MGHFKNLSLEIAQDKYDNSDRDSFNRFRKEVEPEDEIALMKLKKQTTINNENETKIQIQQMKKDYFSDEMFEQLPEFLKKVIQPFKDDRRGRDMVFFSALITTSACFPKVSGIYDLNRVNSNLLGVILGPPSSRKSNAKFGIELACEIHNVIRLYNSEGKIDMKTLGQTSSFFLPANSSTAALMEEMQLNRKIGNLMFESELDIASSVKKQDWGSGYSEIFRKAFHHERISSSRKESGYLEIEHPKLSALFTGTPNQLPGFVRGVEDGLFSRFIFYVFVASPEWKIRHSIEGDRTFEVLQKELSNELLEVFQWYLKTPSEFRFTENQWRLFNDQFENTLKTVYLEYGDRAIGSVQRLGLITYRIAMILSAIRASNKPCPGGVLWCENIDFHCAMNISRTLLYHTLAVFKSIQGPAFEKESEQKERFYTSLPNTEFKRETAVEIGEKVGMAVRTIDNTLKAWAGNRLVWTSHGHYIKANLPTL